MYLPCVGRYPWEPPAVFLRVSRHFGLGAFGECPDADSLDYLFVGIAEEAFQDVWVMSCCSDGPEDAPEFESSSAK